LFFFFFSSRRRHTRLTCDWSSDVCSSDLRAQPRVPGRDGNGAFAPWLERIEKQLTERALDEIIRSIPPEWYADDYDAPLALLEQLHRRHRVPDLILEAKRCNRQPFPNWI